MVPFSPAKKPRPKVATRAGESPRSAVRYGCAGSSERVKPRGLFWGRARSAVAVSAACDGPGDAFGSRDVVRAGLRRFALLRPSWRLGEAFPPVPRPQISAKRVPAWRSEPDE